MPTAMSSEDMERFLDYIFDGKKDINEDADPWKQCRDNAMQKIKNLSEQETHY